MKIYTVGYEGCDIEEFTAFLKAKKIRLIADVRKNPLSRKKGFSKNRLAENLRDEGIDYMHFPGLGVPSAWRKLAKNEEITRKKMFADYVKKILPLADQEFAELHREAKKGRLAILCYEADASDCHRRYVVEKMQRQQAMDVVNLLPRPEPQSLGLRAGRIVKKKKKDTGKERALAK